MTTQNQNKIANEHLSRKAIVYLRQSSISQVKNNIESQKLQYALAGRASDLGFKQVDIIDKDLGASAASGARLRPGFQELLARVAVGDVGIILSRELSRLSRTDKDWCHLMEVCQIFNTLIGDGETVYDPNRFDDQLVLGIKGTISVAELGVLKMRLQQGKEAKAQRGELFSTVAPGYIREGSGIVKDPNQRVQEAIALVFTKFQEFGSVRQVYGWFIENRLELPVNKSMGGGFKISWKLPSLTFIPAILHNPIYAGAYVYGRRPVKKVFADGVIRKSQMAIQPPEQAKVFIKDHHEGYISWETYQKYQRMIDDNGTNFQQDEAALSVREGHGLLSSLLRCARCGHKLNVRYWGKSGTTPRYLCSGDYLSGGKYCIGFSGTNADKCIGHEVLRVISPEGVAASLQALEQFDSGNDARYQALSRQLEQAEYETQRAFIQFDQADPANRLVVDTLERRWNNKLEDLERIKIELGASQVAVQPISQIEKESILGLGQRFSDTWHSNECPMSLKKKIIRLLINEIVVDINDEKQTLNFIIHWHGGRHTEINIPRPLPANKAHKTTDEDLEIIKKMAVRYDDTEIAKVLGKLKRTTGKGHRWTKASVGTARRSIEIKPAPKTINDDVLNMAQAKAYCGVSDSTLMKLIENDILPANQVVTFAAFEIKKSDLDAEPVASILKTLKKTRKLILKGSTPDNQEELFV
jgi:DNA invertase Pin-like site-specific DNA recombinase